MITMKKMLMNPSRRFSLRLSRSFSMQQAEAPVMGGGKIGVRGGPSLYKRLSALGFNGGTVADTMNNYLNGGNILAKFDLDSCVKELRKYGQYPLALEVMEWMNKSGNGFAPTDTAKYLDLTAKVKGISAAEYYFNGLFPSEIHKCAYGALLNCFCQGGLEDKAHALFVEMDKMGIVSTIAFNNLMTLYMKLHQPEKVPALIQELKNRNMPLDMFSYSVWMGSYSSLNDIEAVKRVFEEVNLIYGKQNYDWTIISNLASAYVNVGLNEKAELTLKELEKKVLNVKRPDRRPFHYLLNLYAATSNLAEVHRIWKGLKSAFKVTTNVSTLHMLKALAKLDDVIGLKSIFEEWESTCPSYDERLAKTAIVLYLKHDMTEEAGRVFEHVVKRCEGPYYRYWEMLMSYYLEKHEIDTALECLEAAISEGKNNEWHPTPEDVKRFMEYFKKDNDANGAEMFCKILRKLQPLDHGTYTSLLEIYAGASQIVR
ncbi:hypothetical protein ACET3Z_019092 [Daucus carota]